MAKKITTAAAARKLGKSARWVRLLCDSGVFKGAELLTSRMWIIPESEVDRYIAEQKEKDGEGNDDGSEA